MMSNRFSQLLALATLISVAAALSAQEPAKPKPEDTEVWTPVPRVVTPGATDAAPPSDAIVLFGGKNEDEWVSAQDHTPAQWVVQAGILTVSKAPGVGSIETKRKFKDYQLHIEWKIPEDITGSGQGRGNSGVFLASTGPGDAGYELQVLDSYNNKTYVNGQAGSLYKQYAPLVNVMRKPGEWQAYDVVWTAPVFAADGRPPSPAAPESPSPFVGVVDGPFASTLASSVFSEASAKPEAPPSFTAEPPSCGAPPPSGSPPSGLPYS